MSLLTPSHRENAAQGHGSQRGPPFLGAAKALTTMHNIRPKNSPLDSL
jgi:hypothetical protein